MRFAGGRAQQDALIGAEGQEQRFGRWYRGEERRWTDDVDDRVELRLPDALRGSELLRGDERAGCGLQSSALIAGKSTHAGFGIAVDATVVQRQPALLPLAA